MKLITITKPKVTISKTGNKRKRKMGIFECPVCLKHKALDYSNGLRSETCSRQCRIDKGHTTHGFSGTKIYVCWNNIRLRCSNPKNTAYKYYGGKGISFPKSWETFEGFYADMGSTYKEGLTIDRKDKSLDYSKENCQWVPMELNRIKDRIKSVIQYTTKGEIVNTFPSIAEAARQTGYGAQGIARVARGERITAFGYVWEYT